MIRRQPTDGLVPIICGSRADEEHARAILSRLEELGLEGEIRVASAHKATNFLLELLAVYEADPRPKVYVTVAGRSNALSAVVDANVLAPVIACPPYSDRFGGADIFSSLRLPSGVAPAVVLEPGGAAVLAAKILGLVSRSPREGIARMHEQARRRIEEDDRTLRGALVQPPGSGEARITATAEPGLAKARPAEPRSARGPEREEAAAGEFRGARGGGPPAGERGAAG